MARGRGGRKGGQPTDPSGQALLQVLQGKGDGKGGKKAKPSATPEDKGKYLLDIVMGNVSAPTEKGKGKGKSKGGYAQDGGINALILGVCQDDSHCLDPMGITAENVAEKYGVKRERMDAMAAERIKPSQRSSNSWKEC